MTPPAIQPPYSIGSAIWPGLTKIQEEVGEMNVVIAKIMAIGGTDYYDGRDLLQELIEELADVQAAIIFTIQANKLDDDFIITRTEQKMKLFHEWHDSFEHQRLPAPTGGAD